MGVKVCTKCNIEQDILKYNKCKSTKDKFTNWCKKCISSNNKIWRENNKEKLKIKSKEYRRRPEVKENYNKKYRESQKIFLYNRKRNLKKGYGITLKEYNKIFKEQRGCCKICQKHQSLFKKFLSVDHCHKTGKIRGLLCDTCNRAIGMLKDDIQILQNALQYLQRNNDEEIQKSF